MSVGDVRKALAGVMDVIVKFNCRGRKLLVPSIQLDCQQCHPLIDVVVELSRDPGTLLLVGLNQPPPHVGKRFLRKLALGNVCARAYVPGKRVVRVESRYADIRKPAIFSIMSPEPILHLEGLPPIERLSVGLHTPAEVFRVHTFCATVPQLGLKWPTGELQPRLIEVGARLVGTAHPDTSTGAVGDEAGIPDCNRCI